MSAKRKPPIALLVVGVLALGGYLIDRQRSIQQHTLSGVFEANPSQLSSRLGGRVATIFVKDGEVVKAGAPLVEFEAESANRDEDALKAQLNEAKALEDEMIRGPRSEDIQRQEGVVREAQANLAKLVRGPLPEEIRGAMQKAAQSKAHFDLVKNGPKKDDVQAAKASMEEALAHYQQLQRGLTPEEIAQAKAKVDSAQAAADYAVTESDRQHKLFVEGAVSGTQAEAAYTKARTALADLKLAQEAFARAKLGNPKEEIDQAKYAYEHAKAQYLSLRSGSRPEEIKQAEAEYSMDIEALRLLARGSRKEDVDAARARVNQAQSGLDALKHGNRSEDIERAKAVSAAAKAQLDSLHKRNTERQITAPSDGVIERILIAKGDLLSPNSPVILFINPDDVWIKVYVPEGDLAKVSVGGSATLKIDGIDKPVEAKVDQVATQGEYTPVNLQTTEERGKQVFVVRLRLKSPDRRVKAGMAATVVTIGNR